MFANDKIMTFIKQEGLVTKIVVYESQGQRKQNTAILHQSENNRTSSKSITNMLLRNAGLRVPGCTSCTTHKSVQLRPLFSDTEKTDYNKMEKRWREIKRPQSNL